MRSKNLTNKKQKIFSEKQKGFRDGLSYSTPQKSAETRGNAITQPRSHPIKKMWNLGMGWDRGRVMAFPLVSSQVVTGSFGCSQFVTQVTTQTMVHT